MGKLTLNDDFSYFLLKVGCQGPITVQISTRIIVKFTKIGCQGPIQGQISSRIIVKFTKIWLPGAYNSTDEH